MIVDKQLYCCDKSSINGTFNAYQELQLLGILEFLKSGMFFVKGSLTLAVSEVLAAP